MRLRPEIDKHVVRVQRAVLTGEVIGIQPHQLSTARDRPRDTGLGAGPVIVWPRHNGDGPLRDLQILVPQAKSLADPHPAVQQKTKKQAVPQMVAGVQDRLRLLSGQHLRPRPRRLQLDRRVALRRVLADVVQKRLVGRRRPATPRGLHRDQQPGQGDPVPGVNSQNEVNAASLRFTLDAEQ